MSERKTAKQQQADKASELIQIIHMVLVGVATPLHYRVITDAISDSVDLSEYKRPYDSVYSLMQSDIRKNNGRLLFIKGGMFMAVGAVEQDVADEVCTVPPPKAKKHIELPTVNDAATCGDCQHANYTGIQVTIRQSAYCGCEASGRQIVKTVQPHCPHWQRMSDHKGRDYRKQQLEDIAIVRGINEVIRNSKRQ